MMVSTAKKAKATVAASRSVRAKYRHKDYPDNRLPETRLRFSALGDGTCWCGEPFGHDWEGKADGAPHPR